MKESRDSTGKHYAFFSNTACEYFPCHKTTHPEDFNCLFCYCPLYALGPDCGGNFRYTSAGLKDCTNCLLPHIPQNYAYITGKYPQLVQRMQQFETLPKEHG